MSLPLRHRRQSLLSRMPNLQTLQRPPLRPLLYSPHNPPPRRHKRTIPTGHLPTHAKISHRSRPRGIRRHETTRCTRDSHLVTFEGAETGESGEESTGDVGERGKEKEGGGGRVGRVC